MANDLLASVIILKPPLLQMLLQLLLYLIYYSSEY